MHKRGLKLGIYADFGTKTCAKYPGTLASQFQTDADTFATWKVDMLKLDNCYCNVSIMDDGKLVV